MQAFWLNDKNAGQGWLAGRDTRAKLLVSLLASLAAIFVSSPAAQLCLLLASFIYALGMRRPFILLVAYAACLGLMLIAFGFAKLIAALFSFPDASLLSLAVPFMRLLVTVNVVLPLAFSTSVQSLLGALKGLRLPFILYIPLAVMVRFIPTFAFDLKQIAEALKVRGYRLCWKEFILHPLLSMRFIMTPLLFRSLKTSEDLGIAAELKGLCGGRTMTPYRAPVWRRHDSALILLAVLALAAALACAWFFPAETRGVGGMR